MSLTIRCSFQKQHLSLLVKSFGASGWERWFHQSELLPICTVFYHLQSLTFPPAKFFLVSILSVFEWQTRKYQEIDTESNTNMNTYLIRVNQPLTFFLFTCKSGINLILPSEATLEFSVKIWLFSDPQKQSDITKNLISNSNIKNKLTNFFSVDKYGLL